MTSPPHFASDGDGMNITPLTKVAAVTAALFWAAKATAIAVAGGLDQSPLETPLFMLGLLAFVVAAVTLTWSALAGRGLALRILACVGSVVGIFGFAAITTPVFESLVDSWVGAELNLWVLAVALLIVVALVSRRQAGDSIT